MAIGTSEIFLMVTALVILVAIIWGIIYLLKRKSKTS
jgi:flagellar biogenesis protein FliO